jgi:hypothetical protein
MSERTMGSGVSFLEREMNGAMKVGDICIYYYELNSGSFELEEGGIVVNEE